MVKITTQIIAEHYRSRHQELTLTWSKYFHYGLFQGVAEKLLTGQERTLDTMAELAVIGSRTKLLDVGSGIGSSCLYLARKYECHAVGVDLVGSLTRVGIGRVKRLGLEKRVAFEIGEAGSLPFADESFDVVISNEVLCHVVDRAKAIAEMWRVLKQKGRLVFTDLLDDQQRITAETQQFYDYLKQPVVCESLQSYQQLLTAVGFQVRQIRDYSAEIVSNYEAALKHLQEVRSDVLDLFGLEAYSTTKAFYEYCLSAPIREHIGWGMFFVIK